MSEDERGFLECVGHRLNASLTAREVWYAALSWERGEILAEMEEDGISKSNRINP